MSQYECNPSLVEEPGFNLVFTYACARSFSYHVDLIRHCGCHFAAISQAVAFEVAFEVLEEKRLT